MVVYLDNNSTTQCAPEVVSAMLPFLAERYGNPSSAHVLGRDASLAVARAREQVAECIGSLASEVCFTSGATEANNLAILGLARAASRRRKIVTSSVEHKSVLGPCSFLEQCGFEVLRLPVSEDGVVDLDVANREIDEGTLLVSVQGANNETGTLQPVESIAKLAHERGAYVHCDGAQVLGKIPFSVRTLDVDLCSFSAHKAYGPKGVGCLVVRRRSGKVPLAPNAFGGDQEEGLRPGTLNVPGIVGTGEACRLCCESVEGDAARVGALRGMLEQEIHAKVPWVKVIAAGRARLPGTSSLLIPGVAADALIARTRSVCMSVGSACSSGTLSPSHVLLAMGLSADAARSTVRLSLGRYSAEKDVSAAVDAIAASIQALK